MRKFLKFIGVTQYVSNEQRQKQGLKKLGKGYFTAHRLNPCNPLSYIVVLILIFIGIPIGILLFGFIGFWKRGDIENPFKWN